MTSTALHITRSQPCAFYRPGCLERQGRAGASGRAGRLTSGKWLLAGNASSLLHNMTLTATTQNHNPVLAAGQAALMGKVMLVLVVELAVLPVVYGFWLDICALPLLKGTLGGRVGLLQHAPLSWSLLHWLLGMASLMATAGFLSVIRSVLRPGQPALSFCPYMTACIPKHSESSHALPACQALFPG